MPASMTLECTGWPGASCEWQGLMGSLTWVRNRCLAFRPVVCRPTSHTPLNPSLGKLKLQLYEYRETGHELLSLNPFGAKPPPRHSATTPYYAFTSWQVGLSQRHDYSS